MTGERRAGAIAGAARLPGAEGAAGAEDAAGAALVAALERRFVTATERLTLGGRIVEILRPRSADDLISEADFVRDGRLPYWADLWPAAHVLAARVLEEPGRGRRLLELGCGLGLVAIAAARAGFHVTASDYYEDALRFTRANAWRALGREVPTRLLDWRAPPPDLGRFHLVVAADVLYERPNAEALAEVLARTIRAGGSALIADPGRVAAPAFLAECRARGWATTHEERPWAGGTVRQTVRLLRVTPPAAGGARAGR